MPAARSPPPLQRTSASRLSILSYGGPSGIRTQDRRIKSQWLKLQNSTENAPKTPETAGFRPKEHETTQVSGHLPDTKWRQWRHLKKGGNAGLRPKEHTCANIATVRALAPQYVRRAVNPNARTLASKRAPCLVRWSRARDRVGVHRRRFASHSALAVEKFPRRESPRPSVQSLVVIRH